MSQEQQPHLSDNFVQKVSEHKEVERAFLKSLVSEYKVYFKDLANKLVTGHSADKNVQIQHYDDLEDSHRTYIVINGVDGSALRERLLNFPLDDLKDLKFFGDKVRLILTEGSIQLQADSLTLEANLTQDILSYSIDRGVSSHRAGASGLDIVRKASLFGDMLTVVDHAVEGLSKTAQPVI